MKDHAVLQPQFADLRGQRVAQRPAARDVAAERDPAIGQDAARADQDFVPFLRREAADAEDPGLADRRGRGTPQGGVDPAVRDLDPVGGFTARETEHHFAVERRDRERETALGELLADVRRVVAGVVAEAEPGAR